MLPRLMILVAMAVVCATANANSLELINYPNLGCLGKKKSTLHLPLDSCIPTNWGNYSSMKYTVSSKPATWAVMYPEATGPNCANPGQPFSIECGRCQYNPIKSVGYFFYDCDVKGKMIHAKDRCDSSCGTCENRKMFSLGRCESYGGNGTNQVLFQALQQDHVIRESLFVSSNCTTDTPPTTTKLRTGTASSSWTSSSLSSATTTEPSGVMTQRLQCGGCYGNVRFKCNVTQH